LWRKFFQFTQTLGGKEWMQHELFALAFGTGFKSITIAGCVCNTIFMEFNKKDDAFASFVV
jgi:hypothetical protein